jgi:geranylgeranyl diphosphate synthase, type II
VSEHLAAFRRTFRRAHATSNKLLREQLPRDDTFLREMMIATLRGQVTADYAFVFQNAFCRRESDAARVARIAAAVHLLQSSAFVTDDIFDHTDLRYGHPAVHKEYGVSYAIIAAELMQSAALRTISRELQRGRFPNALAVMAILNRVVFDLYLGQYLDVRNTGNLRMTRRRYDRVIELGVGLYFAQLAKCGALLAGKTLSEVRNLTRFGYHYGMALFITDDMVDILNLPADTGKSFGCDLVNRRMRLPVMLALRMASPRDAAFLRRFMSENANGRGQLRKAVHAIKQSGALAECNKAARRHLTQSLAALRRLSQTVPVQRLAWLSQTLLRAQGVHQL